MADEPKQEGGSAQPFIKKVIKKSGGGHHGGAWKVAYADFVTAMMAFFLLLWLLASSSEEQKQGIAEYFSPSISVSEKNGSEGMFGGSSPFSEDDKETIDKLTNPNAHIPAQAEQKEEPKTDEERFSKAEEELKQAIQSVPELQALTKNLIVDQTPEGLRIQIVDQDPYSMFNRGSAQPLPHTRNLLYLIAQVIKKLPNQIAVSGHTDGAAYARKGYDQVGYGNWELSAERANSVRRILVSAGVEERHFNRVVGKADTEHLDQDSLSSRNRRIALLLIKEELTRKNNFVPPPPAVGQ